MRPGRRYPAGSADVVLCRHVLWALPDPAAVLRRWVDPLRPGGRLVLIEGRWHTDAGIAAEAAVALVDSLLPSPAVEPLGTRCCGAARSTTSAVSWSRPGPEGDCRTAVPGEPTPPTKVCPGHELRPMPPYARDGQDADMATGEIVIGVVMALAGGVPLLFFGDAEFGWFRGQPLGLVLLLVGLAGLAGEAVRRR